MEFLKNFFIKWFLRIKLLAFLFALWAVIFSVSNVLGLKAAFEYDDGAAYTGDAFRAALKAYPNISPQEKASEFCEKDRKKISPYLTSFILKFFGFKIHLIADRPKENASCLIKRWENDFEKIFFTADSQEKYSIIEKNGYLLYFSAYDDGIIQAQKAGVKAFRISRNKNSAAEYDYNPGKFAEKTLPLSYL